MPNPVRAARKEGRAKVKEAKSSVKSYKQNERAKKITEKYNVKADAKGAKLREAQKAAQKAKFGDDAAGIKKMESKGAPSMTSAKKAELKTGYAKLPTATAKKTTSAKKTSSKKSGSKTAPKKATTPAPKPTATPGVKKGLYDGVANPSKKIGDYTLGEVAEGVKNTAKAAAIDAVVKTRKAAKSVEDSMTNQAKRMINAATFGVFDDYLNTSKKKMGGAMKPSYKKGGYMMSNKKKKK